ncbi:MAG: shikimate dehydrogenase [Bacteroidales bacterium]|nr:shikimate dehydrogenase [Bacteroidales bacterium]MCF8389505.1 shikimate dehydrogenase [Bacteroidales bacterium]
MKVYGLIGYPLGHSFSVNYFAEKFAKENITDSKYLNFPIETIEQLPLLLDTNPALRGLNVTIPYKEKVIKFLDNLDDTAERIGAVNTIKIEKDNGKRILTGFNTDAPGFLNSLKPYLTPEITSAIILGTGGASKAISYALKSAGFSITKVSRQKEKADAGYKDIDAKMIENHHLIVNCSPIGTFPNVDVCPDIPYNFLTPEHLVFDLVYNPELTLFMKKAMEKGAKVLNGYQMLINQAEESWKIWNLESR